MSQSSLGIPLKRRPGEGMRSTNERCAQVGAGNHGKVVAIDVETGAYALDENALAAAKRLRVQHPDAEIWFVRVGHRAVHRIGLRPTPKKP
jgi:hypothetical protein